MNRAMIHQPGERPGKRSRRRDATIALPVATSCPGPTDPQPPAEPTALALSSTINVAAGGVTTRAYTVTVMGAAQ